MTPIDRRALIKLGAAGLAAVGTIAALGDTANAAGAADRHGGRSGRGRRSFELVVIRHAEAERNPGPDDGFANPLTALGVEQAALLPWRFRPRDVSAVVSSTRLRTVQTADAICLSQGVPLRTDPALLEISLAGITSVDEANAVIAEWAAGNLDAKTPAGESINEARARALPAFQALIEQHRGTPSKLVVVSHGATMFGVLPALFTNVTMPFATANQPGNTGIVRGEFVDDHLVCTDWLGLPPG